MSKIKYIGGGYKYSLHEDYAIDVPEPFRPPDSMNVIEPFYELTIDGKLIIKAGYAWDGCSGPTWDDSTNMRGGLVHDCLYQILRSGVVDPDKGKPVADKMLHDICVEDGMNKLRADVYLAGVTIGGYDGSHNKKYDKVYEAP